MAKLVIGQNDLASQCPEVAAEWDYEKNGDVTPEMVTFGTNKKYWWKCSKHAVSWETSVSTRTRGCRCPECASEGKSAGKRTPKAGESLGDLYPHLVSEWHPIKNGDMTPYDFKPNSNTEVWWLGECGHEWMSKIALRTLPNRPNGCPYCAGKRVLVGFNDLASHNPELLSEWDYERNGDIDPSSIYYGSSKKAWWVCPTCGHSWNVAIRNRSIVGTGCSVCSNKRAHAELAKPEEGQSFADIYPELAAEWHPTKNGGISPYDIKPGYDKKVWWLGKCGHEWESYTYNRYKGVGCPYCSNQKVLVGFNDLATTNPELSAEWHPTKNGNLTPKDVVAGSQRSVWWIDSFGHEWATKVVSRTRSHTGCPYCANQKVWKGFNDLASTHPDVAAEWHPTKNGEVTPGDVTFGSGRPVWWLSPCGHEWKSIVKDRTSDKPLSCPYCSGERILPGFNDFAALFPEIAAEWHPTKNGKVAPDTQFPYSAKKYWWKCSLCGKEWKTSIVNRTTENAGCPQCNAGRHSSFSEKSVAYYLGKLFDDVVENYHPDDDCFKRMELDIWIPSINTAVEYDGGHWHANVDRDIQKDGLCSKAGIRLIRIRDCKCERYEGTSEVIYRDGESDKASLDKCIEELLSVLGHAGEIDVDTGRDTSLILASMKLSTISGSLAETHPELIAEWDFEKNGDLSPWSVKPRIMRKVWWICPNGHSYQSVIANRSAGHGCRICSYKRVSIARRTPSPGASLAERSPIAASEWDVELNAGVEPSEVSYGAKRKAWFRCPICKQPYYVGVHKRGIRTSVGCGSCAISRSRKGVGKKDMTIDFGDAKRRIGEQPKLF